MMPLYIEEYLLVDEALRWVANYGNLEMSGRVDELRKRLRKRYEEMLSVIIAERSKK